MKRLSVFLCAMVLVLGIVGTSNAALWDRGGGLIYDDALNITWMQDANYAKTSGYDEDGKMTWDVAVAWADGLAYYDSVRDVTWTDWRQPTTVDGPAVYGVDGTTTAGFNITTSEMGYMYYVNLGNLGYYDKAGNFQPGYGLNNTGPFNNLQNSNLNLDLYWSGTEYSTNPDNAWCFGFRYGTQYDGVTKDSNYYAWAVRDGDVAPVPVPGAIWLLSSGLIALADFRFKIQKRHNKRNSSQR
jgi:hypothetical protein